LRTPGQLLRSCQPNRANEKHQDYGSAKNEAMRGKIGCEERDRKQQE
jgi:hypothetical protein